MTAVTFDFGQTLAELDSMMLAARLAQRGIRVEPQRIDAECLGAWSAYNGAKRGGAQGETAWKTFMRTLLARSAVPEAAIPTLTDWLWTEQPHRNLWRRPIPGMLDVARELAGRAIPVGVLSNSEGRLRELVDELGWGDLFLAVVDSGCLPFEKPDPRIFAHAANALGVGIRSLIHIGDAWQADVRGALDAGARAIYFSPDAPGELQGGVPCCHDVAGVRQALGEWGLLT